MRAVSPVILLTVSLFTSTLLSACGSDTEMSTEGYDQTCEIAEDCRVVFVGDVCGCPCEVDAIRTNESTLWARERSNKQDRCDEVLTCQPCPSVSASCDAGTCTASQADTDTDTDSDTSGDTDT